MITKYNPCYYLEKELGVEVINKGKFGSSNQAIANEVMRYCYRNDMRNTALLVVWSDVRRNVEVHRSINDNPDVLFDFDRWQYITGGSLDRESDRLHKREFRNPAIHRMWFEQSVHSVRMICQDYKVPLLMTNSIDTNPLLNKVYWHKSDRHIKFQQGRMKEQWIEGDKPNNSLFDLITNRWLREDIPDLTFHLKHSMIRYHYEKDKSKYPYLTKCFHPWDEGNELIAKTLAPYIKPILEK